MAEPQRRLEPTRFDTLAYAKKLQSVGFTAEQAEVQAEIFFDIVQEQLISKRDIHDLEQRLSRDMHDLEQRLSHEIERTRLEIEKTKYELEQRLSQDSEKIRLEIEVTKKDLKIWFGGMLVVTVTVLTGMMGLIAHLGK